MHIELPNYVRYALENLHSAGYQAVIIGGCVRDALLGKTPSDYDIATNALPEEIMAVFSKHPLVLHGLKHGTVGIVVDEAFVEITTFRVDGAYSDGRRPDRVVFTPELRMDVMRRDFTINAMAYDEKEGIIDEVGGLIDLEKRLVRCVGDPAVRFFEDRLRILRALRFSSTLDFAIESRTAACAIEMRGGLMQIARERIRVEFLKLLCGLRAGSLLYEFRSVFETFLPALCALEDNQYSACLGALDRVPPVPALRLAALFAAIPLPDARAAFSELRMDRVTTNRTCALLEALPKQLDSAVSIKRLLAGLGPELFDGLIDLKLAYGEDVGETRTYARKLIEEDSCISLAQLAVNGEDVVKMGVPKGPKVKLVLDTLLEKVMAGELSNDRDCLYGAMRNIL